MNANHFTSLFVTIFSVTMLLGCSGNSETAPSPEPSDEKVTQPETDDDSEEPDNSIPDDFPKDIHVADGAKTTELKEAGGKKNLILEYPASDIEKFIKSYQDGMTEEGWTLVTSSELPIGTITNFSKDDRKCTISIAPPKNDLIKVAIVLTSDS